MSIRSCLALFLAFAVPVAASAQQDHDDEPPPPQAPAHQHEVPPAAQHQHGQAGASLFSGQEGSGTSWLPAATPMYAWHGRAGQWELMAHGNFFLQFLHEDAEEHRGSSQTGSINWGMAMARRPIGAGRLGLRAMLSAEPATIGGCGYPDLLATGELCDGDSIHDLQHPHDFVMELAADYERPFGDGFRLQLYGGLAGEPALGPVAFPHRLSAMPNPIAPIGHHWLDATHITFGVVTAGVFSQRWKMEASVFNGREPDEHRWNLDFARPDSFSARLSLAPTPSVAIQVSAGQLHDAEPAHDGGGRVDVARVTASLAYHRQLGEGSYWATTLAWGRNLEEGEATHAALLESNLTFSDRHTWFGRLELAGKSAHDLDVHEIDDVFTVAKLQAGYTRYFAAWRGLAPGIGGVFSASIVPPYLAPRYGGRVSPGIGVFRGLAAVAAILVVLAMAVLGYARVTGLRAGVTPGPIETALARGVRRFAIPAADRVRPSPVAATSEAVAAGRAHFADHCASCHGNDGSGETELGRGLFPPAPDLRLNPTQQMTDGELFYVIEQGIRFSGMPAFGTGDAAHAGESWQLVHFIRHLPRITESELEQMRTLNPRPTAEILQEMEEERFLRGEP